MGDLVTLRFVGGRKKEREKGKCCWYPLEENASSLRSPWSLGWGSWVSIWKGCYLSKVVYSYYYYYLCLYVLGMYLLCWTARSKFLSLCIFVNMEIGKCWRMKNQEELSSGCCANGFPSLVPHTAVIFSRKWKKDVGYLSFLGWKWGPRFSFLGGSVMLHSL